MRANIGIPALCIAVLLLCTGWGFFFASSNGGAPSTITGAPTPTPTPSAGPAIVSCAANVATGAAIPLTLVVNPGQGLAVLHKGASLAVDPGVTDSPAVGSPNNWIQALGVNSASNGCEHLDFVPVTSGTGSDTVTVASVGSGLFNAAVLCSFNNFAALDVGGGMPYVANPPGVLTALSGTATPSNGAGTIWGMYYIESTSGAFTNGSTNSTGAGTPMDLTLSGTSANSSLLLGAAWESGAFNSTVGLQRSFSPVGAYCGGIASLSSAAIPVSSLAITPNPASVTTGSTVQLDAQATQSNGSILDVSRLPNWISNGPSIATVSNTGLVTGVSVGNTTVSDSYGGASATTTVNVTSASNIPPPPTLTSPFVVQPGAIYSAGSCTIAGNGTTNDLSCFQSILNGGHDLDIKAGNYLLNQLQPETSTNDIQVPNGRNIYCENPLPSTQSVTFTPTPPAPQVSQTITTSGVWSDGAAVALTTTVSPGTIFTFLGNNEIYGCQLRGVHYPNATWADDHLVSEAAIIMYPTGGNNFTIAENDFVSWGGTTGPITIPIGAAGSLTPSGVLITYNSIRHGAVRGVESDSGTGQITHNYFLDAPSEPEINPQSNTQFLYDSNWFHWVTGAEGGLCTSCVCTGGGNRESAGWIFHAGTGGTPDYSKNTLSNNFVDGTMTNCQFENTDVPVSTIPGVERNNGCTGACTIHNPPGNANSNIWGAGSNQ